MVSGTTAERFHPLASHTIEESGLSFGLLIDLILRHAYFEGTITLGRLTERTKLSPAIIHQAHRYLLKEQLCDTRAMTGTDYEFGLTMKGRGAAEMALKKSQYAGPAPVPLADYNRSVSQQGVRVKINAERLRAAMEDLVVPDDVISALGSALVTGGTILLHGPTGNGKTSIAERLHRVFDDYVYLPHAVEVTGQVLTVFDNMIHQAERKQPDDIDPRWVLCRRPMVKVGGEMRLEMLEPRVDDITRICVGPLQMKANTGILLIDDFGRQRVTPRELLNRWIVPLDRRTDVLSLWSGVSFEIPFELLVVFATNLSLSDLAEDAFMRRLKNKIRIDTLSDALFRQLLRRVCGENNITCSTEMEKYIAAECGKRSVDGLRACFPVDLITIIRGTAEFEQREVVLSEETVDWAVKVYFGQ